MPKSSFMYTTNSYLGLVPDNLVELQYSKLFELHIDNLQQFLLPLSSLLFPLSCVTVETALQRMIRHNLELSTLQKLNCRLVGFRWVTIALGFINFTNKNFG